MLRELVKGTVLLASTVVVVPYTLSLLANVYYGWPSTKRRAFSPKKVYNFNYAFLQKMYLYLRYAPLYFQWKAFYKSADPFRVRKNLAYGRNDCTLDLYIPRIPRPETPCPVVVFVYGGAWGSGDKNMYGLLCSEVANKLNVIVCCPNYSIYPQGYVDDMIQDVVDCISWTYNNVEEYGGNKDKILLLGHSAGAHLCMMAILELLHDELVQTDQSRLTLQESIRFKESHFDSTSSDKRTRKDPDESSGSSGSFCVLNDNGDSSKGPSLDASTTTSTFEMLSMKSEKSETAENNSEETGQGDGDYKEKNNDGIQDIKVEDAEESIREKGEIEDLEKPKGQQSGTKRGDKKPGDEIEEEEKSDNDSVVTVKPRELERYPTLVDLGRSIKGVVGLAGVYHIGDHYVHEYNRGVEDVSCMTRAMYGDDHFERFSPTSLVKTLSSSASLPPIVLIHGTDDIVVPLQSTTKFSEVIKEIYGDVTVRMIPGCDHYEVCLDLMKAGNKYHDSVMGILLETANKVLK